MKIVEIVWWKIINKFQKPIDKTINMSYNKNVRLNNSSKNYQYYLVLCSIGEEN